MYWIVESDTGIVWIDVCDWPDYCLCTLERYKQTRFVISIRTQATSHFCCVLSRISRQATEKISKNLSILC